jgi:predicted nucleic-acid-binding Zn-ribbon protein
MVDEKICPRCPGSQPMGKEEKLYAMPGYIPPTGTEQTGDLVADKRAITISVYRCSQCRYLELYEAHI